MVIFIWNKRNIRYWYWYRWHSLSLHNHHEMTLYDCHYANREILYVARVCAFRYAYMLIHRTSITWYDAMPCDTTRYEYKITIKYHTEHGFQQKRSREREREWSERQDHPFRYILRRTNLYKVIVHLLKVDYFYNGPFLNGDGQFFIFAKNIRINMYT